MGNIKKLLSIFKSPALREIFIWTRGVRGSVLAVCLLTALSTGSSLVTTLVTRSLIDSAIGHVPSAVVRFSIMLVALRFAGRLISVFSSWLRIKTSSDFQRSLQRRVTGSLLSGDYSTLKRFHSGELVNRVFSDVNVVKDGVMSIPASLTATLVSFVGAAAILISMDSRFMILMIVGGILGLGITAAFKEPMKRRHLRMQEAQGKLHSSTQETLENLRLIKAGMSEERSAARMDVDRDRLRAEQIRNGRFSIFMNNGFGLVFDISWLVCMVWGCLNISHGFMTYGSLAAMIQLIGRIQGPIANAAGIAGQAYSMVASADRLKELTDVPSEPQGEPMRSFDSIRFENVTFRYADGTADVLSNLVCDINRGDTIALTGISGEGKSTFLQLILGIYAPGSGKIIFSNKDSKLPACRATRALFAYVPQGNMLFSGTLRENLSFFTDGATDEDIMAAAKAACIDELVSEIGLDAVLGERGIGLSEGQGQRIAVARALMSGAPILLLDESTSALDEATEAALLKNISNMKDKTVIIVTHRRAALEICNKTLRIEGGTISYSDIVI